MPTSIEAREEIKPIGAVEVVVDQENLLGALKSLPDDLHPIYFWANFEIKPQIELEYIPHGRNLSWEWEDVEHHDGYGTVWFAREFIPYSSGPTPLEDVVSELKRREFFPERITYQASPMGKNEGHFAYKAFVNHLQDLTPHYDPKTIEMKLEGQEMGIYIRQKPNGCSIAVNTDKTGFITEDQKKGINDWLSQIVQV